MVRYRHILLAVDFSEGSDQVVRKAAEIAKQMESELTLLHVVEPLPGYGYAFLGAAEIEIKLIEEAKKQLEEVAKKIAVPVKDQLIEVGPTKVEITRIADELKADLIIVGSHGRHGLATLLGSTANAVIHNAKCDVLTVRIK